MYFAAIVSADSSTFALYSNIHVPDSDFSAGILEVFGLTSKSCLVLAHHALLEGIKLRSCSAHLRVYLLKLARIPALHCSAASRSLGAPSASICCWTRVSTASVSHGCVDLRSRNTRLGMQCSAHSWIALLNKTAASFTCIVCISSHGFALNISRILSQSACTNSQTMRVTVECSGTVKVSSAFTIL